MNMAKCDGAMIREDPALISQTKKELEQELDDIEAKLMDGGIGARAFREVLFRYTLSFEDNMASSIAVQGLHTDTAEYLYFSGAAPELANEIAVTSLVAEKLGAHIGDTVNIMIDGENREFMITALYESLTNMGEGVRFSENAVLDYTEKSGAMGIQFALEEDTDAGETEQKLAEIRELFPEYEVMSCEEFADDTIGGVRHSRFGEQGDTGYCSGSERADRSADGTVIYQPRAERYRIVEEYGISGRNADPLAGAQDFSGSDHFDHIGICAHTAAVGLDPEPGFWGLWALPGSRS